MTEKSDKFLAVQKRALAVIDAYRDSQSPYFNILSMGQSGTGKTSIASTCPFPVFIDSFDPGGTKTEVLQEYIDRGDIIVENRWEADTWKKPYAFAEWEREMNDRKREGFFDYLGTYILDSASRWSESMMYEILRKGTRGKSRVGQNPELQDYLVQQLTAVDWIGVMTALPCNIVLTSHLGLERDELTGKIITGPLMYGKLALKLPVAFDEVYIMRPEQTAQGSNYRIQCHADGFYDAKTRLGGKKFQLFEAPDIKAMMKKAGCADVTFTDREPVFRTEG